MAIVPSTNLEYSKVLSKSFLILVSPYKLIRWIGLDWIGLDWFGLDWTGLDWIGLDWIGLDWTGLDGKLSCYVP